MTDAPLRQQNNLGPPQVGSYEESTRGLTGDGSGEGPRRDGPEVSGWILGGRLRKSTFDENQLMGGSALPRWTMPPMVEGLEVVTVHVRDIHQAQKFYADVLGLNELQLDGKVGRAVYAIPGTTRVLRMHVYDPAGNGREPGIVSGIVVSPPIPTAFSRGDWVEPGQ